MRSSVKSPFVVRGLTVLEILAVVAILAILAVLLAPVVLRLLAQTQSARCVSNLRQISTASAAYSADHGGEWPPNAVGVVFANYLIPYLGEIPRRGMENFKNSPLVCPSAAISAPDSNYTYRGFYTPVTDDPKKAKYALSYAQNCYCPGGRPSSNCVPNRLSVQEPSRLMLYMDFQGHYLVALGTVNNKEAQEQLEHRHNGRLNAAFADGSVRAIVYDEIPKTTAEMPHPFWQGRRRTP